MRYRYGDVPMKPYVEQLFSPAGVQVLRDSPHDHKHHHGLMFAVAVDGVDFWGEVPQSGRQKQRSLKTINRLVMMPDGHWLQEPASSRDWIGSGPASDKPLLVERREVCVLENVHMTAIAPRISAPRWSSGDPACRRRRARRRSCSAATTTSAWACDSCQSMDGGRFFNADDKPGEVVRGDERLTPAKWCAYTAKADGKPVTVAIFDHPEEPPPSRRRCSP